MSWRATFLTHLGTGAFSGVTLRQWLRVLRENRFAIDSPYWARAAMITSVCAPNSFRAWREERTYGRQIREATVHPPVFVLGTWRSGTTHLHNLLTRDDRFAFPNNFQVCFPSTFLVTERKHAKLVGFFIPETRPQDNVAIGIADPQEDEFIFCSLTGRTVTMGWAFPRRSAFYDRYLTFREVRPTSEVKTMEVDRCINFVQKLSFKYGKPIVLKSPPHTGRIKMLLDVFPDARFVHIHRNPYDVFRSTQHLMKSIAPWWALQRPDHADLDNRILRQYREVYDAFFEERGLIPQGHYHEVGFEDLEADPIGQVRGFYDGLGLPDFAQAEPALRQYVASIAGYKKNALTTIPAELRERIAREWWRCFEEWGYPR